MSATHIALEDIHDERLRQERLKKEGRFEYTCADPDMTEFEKLAVLTEEVGEVARALLEGVGLVSDSHRVELRKELVQVAAVAAAWCEAIDKAEGK